MNLLIIRHAESVNNRLIAVNGFDDYLGERVHEPPLTDTGEEQAQRLAQHIAASDQVEFSRKDMDDTIGYKIDRLFCSPMIRTMQTAYPVAQSLGLPLEVWRDVFEHGGLFEGDPHVDNGKSIRSFPGMGRSVMTERFPGIVVPDVIREDGWYEGGYEDLAACAARAVVVARDLNALAEEHPEQTIAIVTHGTFINQLLHRILGIPAQAPCYFFHANTGITRVEFAKDGFRLLRYLNRTRHLTAELTTR